MKTLIVLARLATALAILVFLPPAQAMGWGPSVHGSGVPKTEAREISGIRGIRLEISANVDLRQGDGESVTITGDDNIVPLVETVVDNGVLKIRWKERFMNVRYKEVRIAVTAKAIESLDISGSGDIRIDRLNADRLQAGISGSGVINIRELTAKSIDRLDIVGSGDVHIERLVSERVRANIAGSGAITIRNLTANSLDASIGGSGDFDIGGTVNTLVASIAGAGDFRAGRLEARQARISIAGSGDATVWAKETLGINVAGSGDVGYYGDPVLSKSVLGAGSLKRLGAAPPST